MAKRKKRPVRVFIRAKFLAEFLRQVLGRHRPVSTTGSILLVDDELVLLDILKQGLEEYFTGFSILTAKDGFIAKEKLKKNAVSLVVTNLNMPGINGFELLDYIKVNYPDILVIICSGYHGLEKSELAREKGAVAYLRKPFRIENLVETIRGFLK
ncbi:MAG: response regulator [Deltaproteobacteria bacterium]|nr:response regulator [Deltaproteobacteria bacterium]MBW1736378.1 response regulator [Deltaproteobacteria bacterium]MBW2033999.1 response regulator [Deltaproteobacteria bacterium]MBW2113769.1 response regulator [Deltaproteobacteria bacterium]